MHKYLVSGRSPESLTFFTWKVPSTLIIPKCRGDCLESEVAETEDRIALATFCIPASIKLAL